MAIQVTNTKTTREGVELSSYYIRLEVSVPITGDKILAELYHYSSKDAFKAGYSTICKNELNEYAYNMAVDGEPVKFAHDKVVEEFGSCEIVDLDG